jgi:hypothetical protein
MRIATLSLAVALSLAGCPSASTSSGDSGVAVDAGPTTDAAQADDVGTGADAGAPADAATLSDGAAAPCSYVDTLDRTCAIDGDCAVGLHQTDCCGSSVMIGFRSTEQATYASSESACMASYPGCGCPATLPTTDSGETVTDTGMVHAACVIVGPTRRCETYVSMRPPDGR